MNRDSDDKVPSADSADNGYIHDVIGNKDDTVAGTSLMAATKRIEAAVGGEAMQLRTEQSKSGAVEEDAIMSFGIGIFDVDTGAIISANIDITGIIPTMEKSTGGGAFSDVGITQPTFGKANGLVSVDYRFLAAEWEIGDVYKLAVSGITATIGADTAYVKTMIWSNMVMEEVNIEAKIDAIQLDIGDVSARTNLQTLMAMLGNPDAAGKSIYGNIGDFVGQTNLQTLLAVLGIPDVAGKPLYTCLVTDRLDNGTYGLESLKNRLDSGTYGLLAIKTLIDAIQADVILQEVETIEQHFHAKSRVFGISSDQSGNDWATEDRLTSFVAISGNGDYGSDPGDEAKVFGTDDTPFISGQTHFDPGFMTVSNVSNDNMYIIRIVWGTGTMADAISAGQYSARAFKFDSTNPQLTSNELIHIGTPVLPVGTKIWVQVKNNTDNATLNFFIDAHGYTR